MRGHRTLPSFFLALLVSVLGAAPVFAVDIPGVRTPIPIIRNNMLSNGDFESGVNGWLFGNINRALINWGAQSGSYFLDTSNCGSCPTEFGNTKTLAYDVTGDFATDQLFSASVYFRSPQGGQVRLAFWELGNSAELLGVFDKTGDTTWQKMEINTVALRFSGNQTLRVQIYIDPISDNTNYNFDNFVLTQEGSPGNCPTSYYTYQRPLVSSAPTLADLFDGKAHFQNIPESQLVNLQFDPSQLDTGYANAQPSKLSILYNPVDGKYYTYSRAFGTDSNPSGRHFNMYLMSSTDGVIFSQVGPIFDPSVIQQMGDMYDGHIAIDYSVCPTRYVMALECSGSMCASYSTDPFNPSSWSRPVSVVSYDLEGHKSASTGVYLIDGNNTYASWTLIDDGPLGMNKDHDVGIESAYTRAIATTNPLSYLGSSGIGTIVLPAEPNTHCTSSWDCNNRDTQDWKKEGGYYYLIYNGANYYRCFRFPGDTGTNDWGNGIVRSTNPLSGYNLTGVGKMHQSLNTTLCAVSYPVINAVEGELYMYYAYNNVPNDPGPQSKVARSKLVWNTPVPGDVTGDRKVNVADIIKLLTQWSNPYTIFDYNLTVANYGRP